MTIPTNWPDPAQPGVPMFPERDGLHAVLFNTPTLGFWMSKGQRWGFDGDELYYSPDDASKRISYIGPALIPAEITEMLAAERERCAKVCDKLKSRELEVYGVGLSTTAAERTIRAYESAAYLIRKL